MATVTINPGDDIQVDGHDAANAGDTVSLTAGNYFNQTVNLTKNNLTFESATGNAADVVIYGGPQVTGFSPVGGYYVAASGITPTAVQDNSAENLGIYDRGAYKLMVSVDLDYYHHVSSTTALSGTPPTGATGLFYYDYATNNLWLSDDPSGKVVVISSNDSAFVGSATGLTVQDLTISTYEASTEVSCIGGGLTQSHGASWMVKDNIIKNIHGTAVHIKGNNSTVQNNEISYVGQLGLAASGAVSQASGPNLYNLTVYNNLIQYTNMKAYKPTFGAGATKFSYTDLAAITHNDIWYNKGFALWATDNCYDFTYKWNDVQNNMMEGIKHEKSFCAYIQENFLSNNGNGNWPAVSGEWPEGVQNSGFSSAPGIAIDESNGYWNDRPAGYANTLVPPYGIIIEDNYVSFNQGGVYCRNRYYRSGDTSFPGTNAYDLQGVKVRNNDIWWDGGGHGIGDNAPGDPCSYTGDSKIEFTDNDYTLNGQLVVPTSGWDNCGGVSYAGWQATGFDTTNAGRDAPTEPFGRVAQTGTDEITLGYLDLEVTVNDISVISGTGNLVLEFLDLGMTFYDLQVSAGRTDTQRINVAGPLVAHPG